ncbi:YHYH domain-containing protein [Magnetovibrio sp. PR-2]
MFRALFIVLATLGLFASQAYAHGGGLDSSGCHWNHKTGTYHCHRSP